MTKAKILLKSKEKISRSKGLIVILAIAIMGGAGYLAWKSFASSECDITALSAERVGLGNKISVKTTYRCKHNHFEVSAQVSVWQKLVNANYDAESANHIHNGNAVSANTELKLKDGCHTYVFHGRGFYRKGLNDYHEYSVDSIYKEQNFCK